MKTQLAKLYRNGRFTGYGVAVNGELLSSQVSTVIDSDGRGIPTLTAVFNLNSEQVENAVVINLSNKNKTCQR